MLADTLGRPLRFIVTASQVGDVTTASALLNGLSAQAVLANKAYDGNNRARSGARRRPLVSLIDVCVSEHGNMAVT